ncbi:MAG TPA: DMT family transporter [Beijerinckiaceae bacterium]|nr:DMT family transporter [Beijerinckiaceae bacterium]
MLWAAFTVLASGAQTLRNATQRDLTGRLGALGAAHVRFLFGFPFGLGFLALALLVTGEPLPRMDGRYFAWTAAGGLTQIAATALMLSAMTRKSFVVTTAYTKTEPVQVAIFGLVFLGDRLTPLLALAILIATTGVMILGWPRAAQRGDRKDELQAALSGIAAGGLFALSAICFRGGIHALADGSSWMRASTTLAVGLGLQTLVLLAYLLTRDRGMLAAILAAWRPSLAAGFLGAAASQFWFLAFALTTAARVRTLALIEVLFAYAISGRLFRERLSLREVAGMGLVVVGVALSLNA